MGSAIADRSDTETTPLRDFQAATRYVESIAEKVREPFVILNRDLCIVTANPAFYRTFEVSKGETEGQLIYEVGNHQWDIPKLKRLLGEILPANEKFN